LSKKTEWKYNEQRDDCVTGVLSGFSFTLSNFGETKPRMIQTLGAQLAEVSNATPAQIPTQMDGLSQA
jgi:hypothetical protein